MEIKKVIPFNRAFVSGNEMTYIREAINENKLSGNGRFTQLCQKYFEERYNILKCLMTTSCTDALEMCSILAGIKPGDEVIVPSFTFVSSALAFVRDGARIVFCDSRVDNPNIDEEKIEELVTARTKAIVVVHYAGVACHMDKIMEIANKYNLVVIEDAAQAIESYYTSKTSGKRQPLGSIGHLAAFSFHETKNLNCGEGGLLAINDPKFISRAEIIWEKGTNRAEFFRGQVNKYGWKDLGSSFLPSEINSAFLYAQLEQLETVQQRRVDLTNQYRIELNKGNDFKDFKLSVLPEYGMNNGHMFYLLFRDLDTRNDYIRKLKDKGVMAVFHYQSLHKSEYYLKNEGENSLPNSDRYSDTLLRLPLFYDLSTEELNFIVKSINE